jgi:hypothetical protein
MHYQVASDVVYAMPLHVLNRVFLAMVSGGNGESLLELLRSQMGCLLMQVFLKRGNNATVQLQRARARLDQYSQTVANLKGKSLAV